LIICAFGILLWLSFAAKFNTKDLDRKIRVGAVSYLNTKPLLYGILHSSVIDQIELKIDYPAKIGEMLLSDEIDLGLVPISIIPQMPEYYVNTRYCIGSDGAVASVCLFSDVPMEKIDRILLDYQSKTSGELTRILLRDYWKIQPELVNTKEDFRSEIKGTTAGLLIGDRALEQRRFSPFIYDLGEGWKNFTGLPFVFAAWISNKPLVGSFVEFFEKANAYGIHNLQAVLDEWKYDFFDLRQYYTRYISYILDPAKKEGLRVFLEKIQDIQ
jgi:chorismate dehydratase